MATEATPTKKSVVPRIVLGLAVLGLGYYGYSEVHYARTHESTDNAQIEANTVPAIARVAGYIKAVRVADYARVKKGDTLVLIDDAEYRIGVAQAEADLAQAQADLAVAQAGTRSVGANVQVARANVDAAQVRLKKAADDLKRDKALFAERSITKSQLDNTQATFDNAQKAVLVSEDQVAVAEAGSPTQAAQILRARATVKARQAALDNARLRLTYTSVIAQIDGKTGKNNLVTGQYVQPGQTLFNVVDDQKFWVVANFKETQVANLHEGMEVEVKIDAYEDEPVKGRIVSLSEATGAKFSLLPPDNATGNFVKVTQRVPVKIELPDAAALKGKLRAGLSVEVTAQIEK